jgi:hypothetical protein
MWKEAVVAYYEALSWHLPAGTGKSHESVSQEDRYPDLDQLRDPPNLQSSKWCESDNLPATSTEVKNAWSFTYTSPHISMAS